MLDDDLNEDNFILLAAKWYENNHFYTTEEFYDDLKKFGYLNRLFGLYKDKGDLRERLILNHIIILYNMFGNHATKLLFLRVDKKYHECLKTFLVYINRMPSKIGKINGVILYSSDVKMDDNVIQVLRKMR